MRAGRVRGIYAVRPPCLCCAAGGGAWAAAILDGGDVRIRRPGRRGRAEIGRRGRYGHRVMEDAAFKDSRRAARTGAGVAAYVIYTHSYGDPLFASRHAGLEACMWSIGSR